MIIYFRLITGVELIGEVIREDKVFLTVKKPMKIDIREQDGMGFFILVPFCAGTDTPTFRREHIMTFGDAEESFVTTYKKLMAAKPEQTSVEGEEDSEDLFEFQPEFETEEDSEESDPAVPAGLRPAKPTLH